MNTLGSDEHGPAEPCAAPEPPLALLAAIQKEDARKKRGKLKVFFGMALRVSTTGTLTLRSALIE